MIHERKLHKYHIICVSTYNCTCLFYELILSHSAFQPPFPLSQPIKTGYFALISVRVYRITPGVTRLMTANNSVRPSCRVRVPQNTTVMSGRIMTRPLDTSSPRPPGVTTETTLMIPAAGTMTPCHTGGITTWTTPAHTIVTQTPPDGGIAGHPPLYTAAGGMMMNLSPPRGTVMMRNPSTPAGQGEVSALIGVTGALETGSMIQRHLNLRLEDILRLQNHQRMQLYY